MISTELRRSQVYVGDGKVSEYTFPYRIFDSTQLKVLVRYPDDTEDTTLEESQYSVSLVEDAQQVGGSITLQSPLPDGAKLCIVSNIPYTQLLNLRNQGSFNASDLNNAWDKNCALIQQIRDEASDAIRVSPNDDFTPEELKQKLFDAATDATDATVVAKVYAEAAKASAEAAAESAASASTTEASVDAKATDLIKALAGKGAEQVGVVGEAGDAQIERIQNASDNALMLGGLGGDETSWTLSAAVSAGTEIPIPNDAKYVVGRHHLRLSLNGTVLQCGKEFFEVGSPEALSSSFSLSFDAKSGDELNAWIAPLGTKDMTESVATAKRYMEASEASASDAAEAAEASLTAQTNAEAALSSSQMTKYEIEKRATAIKAELDRQLSSATSQLESTRDSAISSIDSNKAAAQAEIQLQVNEANAQANAAAKSASQSADQASASANSAAESLAHATEAKNSSASAQDYAQAAERQAEYAEAYVAELVNPDWNATSGKAQILNKPDFSEVEKLKKKVAVLEAVAEGRDFVFETNSEDAYSKAVSAESLGYAAVKSLGGKTIVLNQLCKQNSTALDEEKNGVRITREKGSPEVKIKGTCTERFFLSSVPGATSPITGNRPLRNGDLFLLFYGSGASSLQRIGFDYGSTLNGLPGGDTPNNDGAVICSIGTEYRQSSICQARIDVGEHDATILPRVYNLTSMFGKGHEPSIDEAVKIVKSFSSEYKQETLYSKGIDRIVAKGELIVPDAVKALPGYGLSAIKAKNWIDWENKKYHREVEPIVITSDAMVTEYQPSDESFVYCAIRHPMGRFKTLENGDAIISIGLPYLYKYASDGFLLSGDYINIGAAAYLQLGGTPDSIKNLIGKLFDAGNPLTVVAALAEPEIIDISDILTNDCLVEVEPGGEITFKSDDNDIRLNVPSEVVFQNKVVTNE